MQKWEYAGARVWRGLVLSTNIGGKIEQHGEPYFKASGDYRLRGTEVNFVEFLNRMGQEGWDLVSLCPSEIGSPGNSIEMRAILKRPRA